MKLPIYLDYHATTPVDPRVLEAMLPYFSGKFGNAASQQHHFGWEAEAAVEKARSQVARLIGAKPGEIFFTSGATESNNLALLGLLEPLAEREPQLITSNVEHSSIQGVCERLEKKGVRVEVLSVNKKGAIDVDALVQAIGEESHAVSLLLANNEIGTLQAVSEIGRACKENGLVFHVDAAQALGKIPIDVEASHIDLLSISAHKNYGPKGVGALYVRSQYPPVHLQAQIHGGGHEKGLRSGTLNVPGIVGLGKACEISMHEMEKESEYLASLRDHLQTLLLKSIEGAWVNGDPEHRLPHNLSLSLPGVRSERLMMNLKKELAISSGSACASSHPKPSHVLKAIGLSDEMAACTVRFGLGRFSSREEIEFAARRVAEESAKIRG